MAVTRKMLSGLNTEANPRQAPEGAMEVATNVVCRRAGTIEPRPGVYQSSAISAAAAAQNVVPYDGNLTLLDDAEIVSVSAGADLINAEYPASVTGWDGYCSAVEARGNLYLATQVGVQKVLSAASSSSYVAGAHHLFEQLLLTSNVSSVAAENFLANGESVAYRAVIRNEDANGVITRSAPSRPVFFTNATGVAVRVALTVDVFQNGAYTNATLEIYRTKTTTVSAPPDSYSLTVEVPLAGAVLAGGYTVYDVHSDDELGLPLYSNSGQEGRIYSPPRHGRTLGSFAGSLFVGNLRSPQYKFLRRKVSQFTSATVTITCDFTNGSPNMTNVTAINPLYTGAQLVVGMFVHSTGRLPASGGIITAIVGSTVTLSVNAIATAAGVTGVAVDDTITITDGTTTEIYRPFEFVDAVMSAYAPLYTGVLKTGPSALVIAKYLSGYLGNSGTMTNYDTYIEEIPGTIATLQIKATNAAALYNSEISEHAAGFADLDRDDEPALMEWSLLDQPETFIRGISQVYVGDHSKAIWAMVTSGTRMYVTKDGDGIWFLDGQTERSGFRLQQLTQDYQAMSPRHQCQGTMGLYLWTDDGVIRIDQGGGIKRLSGQVVTSKLDVFRRGTDIGGNMFAADNEVHLIASQTLKNVQRTVHLVFHEETEQWTEWELPQTPIVGCSPGLPISSEVSPISVVANTGSVRIWSVPRVVTVSGNEAPLEHNAADVWSGTTSVSATPAASATAGFYMLSFTVASVSVAPVVGDMFIGIDSSGDHWKGVITAISDAGGGVFVHTFWAAGPGDPTDVSGNVQILYSFEVSLRLRALASDDPLAWRHWIGAYWEFLAPTSLFKVTVGCVSSDSLTASTAVQKARNYSQVVTAGGTPTQPGFSPRYLFTSKHGRAKTVRPTLSIREAGAIWAATAISLEEVRGSMQRHRNT